MIFQKSAPKPAEENILAPVDNRAAKPEDTVETVVGPSVNVEGDFASEGNIVVKGSVAGSVHTSKHLVVEPGARIMANVRAGSAQIAGEVKGNMKIKEDLEILATARILGDIEVKVLAVEPGALIFGKISMPGMEDSRPKPTRGGYGKKIEDESVVV